MNITKIYRTKSESLADGFYVGYSIYAPNELVIIRFYKGKSKIIYFDSFHTGDDDNCYLKQFTIVSKIELVD